MINKRMLSLDISVVFIIFIVWFLMLILNKVYYKPIGNIITQRETKIDSDTRQIESLTTEIENKTNRIESILKETEKESRKIRESLIEKGEKAKEMIILNARESSKDLFEKKMEELGREINEAEQKLESEIEVYSKKIKELFL